MHKVGAAGRTVSDLRIRDQDVTPVLGRGFSLATGSLQSSCLEVVERTKPSYNYDYYFTEVKGESEDEREASFSAKFKTSLSYWGASADIESSASMKSSSKVKKTKHFMLATMRSERYYDSVDEIHARLSPDAQTLLEDGQYISFFQACGPNYIRSIRRAQEVTAIFEYESNEKDADSEFEAALKVDISGYGQSGTVDTTTKSTAKSHSKNSSLKITVKGFGLGLNEDGAGNLVAKGMEDFMKVMEFAFQSMQAVGIGMVQAIEIVPWVDNPQFQVAAGLATILKDCGLDDDGEAKVCTSVSSEIKKMHLSQNGEYVATMNRVMRDKIDKLYNMQQCRSMLHAWPQSYEHEHLINVREDAGFIQKEDDSEKFTTVGVLKDYVKAEEMNKQVEVVKNYIEYFYAPCIEALSAEYDGQRGGVTLVKSWYSIEECKDVVCTVQGVTVGEGPTCTIGAPDVGQIAVDLFCMPVLKSSLM